MSDAELRQRLAVEPLLFLTNDTEFEDLAADCRAQVIISRLPQRLPIAQRVDVWFKALQEFFERKSTDKLFDLLPDGRIVAWEIREGGRILRHEPDGS